MATVRSPCQLEQEQGRFQSLVLSTLFLAEIGSMVQVAIVRSHSQLEQGERARETF